MTAIASTDSVAARHLAFRPRRDSRSPGSASGAGLLRKYQLAFMQLFAPHLTRRVFERAADAYLAATARSAVRLLGPTSTGRPAACQVGNPPANR